MVGMAEVVVLVRPNIGRRVTREGHARFWERPEVKFLRATRQTRSSNRITVRSGLTIRNQTS